MSFEQVKRKWRVYNPPYQKESLGGLNQKRIKGAKSLKREKV
jgi:hypothetical protein